MIRRQLPAYSPVLPAGLARASLDAAVSPRDVLESFEHELRHRFDAELVVLTDSGTHALQLALTLDGLAPSTSPTNARVVALPAYSCFDLVTAAVGAEARIAFYDVDPNSLTPDSESLHEALGAGATVVVAANAYGFPLDWDVIRAECDAAGALLVEDAAQALGSTWGGGPGGSFGDVTVLSFGRGKGWSGGGGGALLARGEIGRRLASAPPVLPAPGRAVGVKAFALSSALWLLGRPAFYRLPTSLPGLGLGETVYKAPSPVSRMSSAHAAIALRHAKASHEAIAVRRTWALRWSQRLGDDAGAERGLVPCRPVEDGESGYLRYPVLCRSEDERAPLLERSAAFGVTPGYPRILPKLDAARSLAIDPRQGFPGADALVRRLVTFPTHPHVSQVDLDAVVPT